jgi:hypothetical protein
MAEDSTMPLSKRRSELLLGALFGAWLGGAYVFISQAVNRLFLPGIPLSTPSGSFLGYLFQYLLVGALLGIICMLPDGRLPGVALGGLCAALLLAYLTLSKAWGADSFGGTVILVFYTFLPLVVLMMPLAFLIRLGVDAQQPDPSRPYLWARRYLVPLLLTLVVGLVASFSLYGPEVRKAFHYTDQMIQQGMAASGEKDLPVPLSDVAGFSSKANGPYSLAWSDRLDTYFGPVPAGAELSQFLIIARFENGFAFACVFSENRSTPSCTNY